MQILPFFKLMYLDPQFQLQFFFHFSQFRLVIFLHIQQLIIVVFQTELLFAFVVFA